MPGLGRKKTQYRNQSSSRKSSAFNCCRNNCMLFWNWSDWLLSTPSLASVCREKRFSLFLSRENAFLTVEDWRQVLQEWAQNRPWAFRKPTSSSEVTPCVSPLIP